MDEGVFIIVALVIMLGLIAGRILRSHSAATARVSAKKALRAPAPPPRDDRATVPMAAPPEALEPATEAAEDNATRVLARADIPAKASPPQPC